MGTSLNIKLAYEFDKESISFQEVILQKTYTLCLQAGITICNLHLDISTMTKAYCFSQALRVSKIGSYEKTFKKHMENMKSWFHAKSYPKHLNQKKMEKNMFSNISRGICYIYMVRFVVKYHPLQDFCRAS